MNITGIETRNLEQYKLLHASAKSYGRTSEKLLGLFMPTIRVFDPKVILDYGAGQSTLAETLTKQGRLTYAFDPAIPERATIPAEFFTFPYEERMVVCSHVLEHLDRDEITAVLNHIKELAPKALVAVPTTAARRHLPSGENAHATVESKGWWITKIQQVFPEANLVGATTQEVLIASSPLSVVAQAAESKLLVIAQPSPELQQRLDKLANLEGRRVAVVGRAASLLHSEEGAHIDAHDVVVRINARLPLPPKLSKYVGRKTDLVYTCRGCSTPRRNAWNVNVPSHPYNTELRRKLSDPGGYTPFTGTVAVFEMLDRGAAQVYATGMDLYVGPPTDGKGGRLRLKNTESFGFHDPNRDKELFKELLRRMPDRFIPSPVLRKQLLSEEPLKHFQGLTP
jgi:hypothetical protein